MPRVTRPTQNSQPPTAVTSFRDRMHMLSSKVIGGMRRPFISRAQVAVLGSPFRYHSAAAVIFGPIAGAFGWRCPPLFGVAFSDVDGAEPRARLGYLSARWVGADALGSRHDSSPTPT